MVKFGGPQRKIPYNKSLSEYLQTNKNHRRHCTDTMKIPYTCSKSFHAYQIWLTLTSKQFALSTSETQYPSKSTIFYYERIVTPIKFG